MSELQSIDLSNPKLYNPIYIPLIYSKKRNILIYGSRDSAKSDFVAGQIIKHLLSEEYCRVILIRKIGNSIKDSQFQTIKDVVDRWGLTELFYFTSSPLHITCRINGNKVLCRGLDNPEKTKSISNPTIIWYEEADELTLEDYIKTSQSLRCSKKDALIREYFTFNPEDEEGYLTQVFFPESRESYEKEDGNFHYVKSKRDDTDILHTTFLDNRFCNAERRASHERLKEIDLELYKIYSKGLWGNKREGLVYPKYNIIQQLPEIYDYRIWGIDWGFANDPKVLIEIRIRSNYLYVKEHIYETHLRTCDMIERMKSMKISMTDEIYYDSEDPEKGNELILAGFNAIGQYKPKDSVKHGIELIWHHVLNVEESSENIRYELKNYRYKKTQNNNNAESSDPVKANDHSLDALRASVFTHYKYNSIEIKA